MKVKVKAIIQRTEGKAYLYLPEFDAPWLKLGDEVELDLSLADKFHPCPDCGAPGVEVCSGCGTTSNEADAEKYGFRYRDDCGCPCGTGYSCSQRCWKKK